MLTPPKRLALDAMIVMDGSARTAGRPASATALSLTHTIITITVYYPFAQFVLYNPSLEGQQHALSPNKSRRQVHADRSGWSPSSWPTSLATVAILFSLPSERRT